MRRITILRALAALALVAGLATITATKHAVPTIYAASGCSIATLHGSYAAIQPAGFTTHHATTGSEVPWQVVGIFTFDGSGNTFAAYTAAVDGAIYQKQTSAGTYAVNPDCTGTISLTTGDAAGYAADLAISGSGAEMFGISTSAGDTATFDAKKQ